MRWLHVVIDVPEPRTEVSTDFWSGVLGWPAGPPWPGEPAFVSFVPTAGSAYVHRQSGAHGPRTHLDLEVDDVAAETERLRASGARVGERRADWQVMESPGGLPFCLLGQRPRTVPPPAVWAKHRSRLVQVCIDSPPDRHDAEVDFWRTTTGWRWVPGDAPEFAGKLYPEDGPVQLLLQRLGVDTTGEPTRAHIDLGTDDLDAEADRIVSLGAGRGRPGSGWVVLTDPAGMVFCATENPPVTRTGR